MTEDEKEIARKFFLVPFKDVQHCHDWVEYFLGVDLPMTRVDPESNSSPAEAIFETYNNYLNDLNFQIPGYIWLSSRDSYKTLSESILAVALMAHFNIPIAHLAAIKAQSEKAISYVNSFLRKIAPVLELFGRTITSETKSKAQVTSPNGEIAYVNVIVCTMAGANSEHVPYMSFDELDVIRFPEAYEEAKLIPTRYKNKGPLTVKCSTRKFAFGIMEKELGETDKTGEKVLRWNILDVTEKCPKTKHQPELPKVIRYIKPRSLPLTNLSPEEYLLLSDPEKKDCEKIEAYSGCASCPLLSVCQTRLAHRPDTDVGGLYKPVDFTIRQFKITSAEMAEAQLLCWKPTSAGLVYPRFEDAGNTITIEQAWERFTGNPSPRGLTLKFLSDTMTSHGVKFYVGIDWGSTHPFAITVSALVGEEWWFIDSYVVAGLEFDQMMDLIKKVKTLYNPSKAACDTAQPMFIKATKKLIPCPNFTKDVQGGIALVRTKICDATGTRRLKVIRHERNEILINGFKKHHFKLDSQGNATDEPDDEIGTADALDTVRYLAQILFDKSGGATLPPSIQPMTQPVGIGQHGPNNYNNWLSEKIQELTPNHGGIIKTKSGSIIADFGDDDTNS